MASFRFLRGVARDHIFDVYWRKDDDVLLGRFLKDENVIELDDGFRALMSQDLDDRLLLTGKRRSTRFLGIFLHHITGWQTR